MENYIISEKTLAIIPYNGKTKVIESYITYIVNKKVSELLEESCNYYGSSLKGRMEGTYYLTGIKYKCPILISETKYLIVFPSHSYQNIYCSWFNYKSIDKYYINEKKELIVILKNQQKIKLDISSSIFNNQIFKSSRLESVIRSNIK